LLPFPWEKIGSVKKNKGLDLTPEQQRKRIEELLKKLGDEII
jgi:hypothetical protein